MASLTMRQLFSSALPIARPTLRPLLPMLTPRFVSYNANPNTQQPASPKTARKTQFPARVLRRDPIAPPTKTTEELAQLPWIVPRTPYAQLPVYRRFKSGGTLEVVLIKKVEGDQKLFLEQLTGVLGVDKDRIRINPVTRHIEVKGPYFDRTRDWLLENGF